MTTLSEVLNQIKSGKVIFRGKLKELVGVEEVQRAVDENLIYFASERHVWVENEDGSGQYMRGTVTKIMPEGHMIGTCTRCGGTGDYGVYTVYGRECLKCGGSGKTLVKIRKGSKK